jgi:hypothetical protein
MFSNQTAVMIRAEWVYQRKANAKLSIESYGKNQLNLRRNFRRWDPMVDRCHNESSNLDTG